MSLIVEDGTIVAGAESYISAADADQYHVDRNNAGWTGSALIKEAALRNATAYMIQFYRLRWKGSRMDQNQVLDWPRGYVYLMPFIKGALYPYGTFPYMVPNNVVPDLVKHACAEFALRALTAPLYDDESQVVEREQVGSIVVNYSKYSPQRKRYVAIDSMLAEFLLPGGGASSKLVRV